MPLTNIFVTSLAENAETDFKNAVDYAGELIDQYIAVAGSHIQLRFAGDTLLNGVMRAFSHLKSAPVEEPDLTVHIWDKVSTLSRFHALQESPEDISQTSKLVFRESSMESPALFAKLDSGIVNLLDTKNRRAFFFVPDAACFPVPEAGAPLLPILHGWFSEQHSIITHSAVVGTESGGVLIAGRSGSGKSSTALSCMRAGFGYVADDYCLLTMESGFFAHCLFGSAKVDSAGLKLLGMEKMMGEDLLDYGGKTIFFVNQQWPQRILHTCPIRAILLPRIGNSDESHLLPATSAQAIRAIAPSTILQLPGPSSHMLRLMAHMVKKLPCYKLEIGHDLNQIADIIRKLLEKL